ncbi:hypothetical protein [Microbaculum marinum]|uniref:Cupin domain-containing protein n=1 Tax=Microbaculum marinum TaxID=1764581 RepID=A0AAW9RW88_9HYPH
MSKLHLIASLETFEKGGRMMLPRGNAKALYVVDGAVRCDGSLMSASLAANSAAFLGEDTELLSRDGATVIRWDLSALPDPVEASEREGVTAKLLLSSALDIDPNVIYLLRCDRVAFPPGGVAYLHTHRGPGTRVLLSGSIRIDTDGASHHYEPLQAWYESGPAPVFAAASETEPTAFARVMILPAELKGQSSIRYEREEDKDKPKPQSYQVYLDRLL